MTMIMLGVSNRSYGLYNGEMILVFYMLRVFMNVLRV